MFNIFIDYILFKIIKKQWLSLPVLFYKSLLLICFIHGSLTLNLVPHLILSLTLFPLLSGKLQLLLCIGESVLSCRCKFLILVRLNGGTRRWVDLWFLESGEESKLQV